MKKRINLIFTLVKEKTNNMKFNRQKIMKKFEQHAHIIRYIFIFLSVLFLHEIWTTLRNENAILKDAITGVASCAIIITIFYSVLTYEFNNRKTKTDAKTARDVLTYNAAVEWHKPVIFDQVLLCFKVEKENPNLLQDKNGEEFHNFVQSIENIAYKKALSSILNYLESISLGIKQGIIDEKFMKGFFQSIFKETFQDYNFYISYRRKVKKNSELWENFTNLAEKWN